MKAIPGLTSEDLPIRWTEDARALYVQRGAITPARIDIVDVTTGQARFWKELKPPDTTGVHSIGPIVLTADGSAYVYSYRRLLDDYRALSREYTVLREMASASATSAGERPSMSMSTSTRR